MAFKKAPAAKIPPVAKEPPGDEDAPIANMLKRMTPKGAAMAKTAAAPPMKNARC